MALQNHAARASARGATGLVLAVYRDVRRAGVGVFATSVALAVAGAGITLAQVVVGAQALGALVTGGALDPAALVVPLAVLAGLAALGQAVGAATSQVRRLLEELVLRDIERRILDVTTGVPLEAFETPDFVTLLARVQHNALTAPAEMVRGLIALATGLVAAAGLGVVIVAIDPLLLPLLLACTVPVWFVNRLAARREFAFATEHAADLRERLHLGDVLQQRATAKEVRAFAVAPVVRRRWEDRYDRFVLGVRHIVATRIRLAIAGAAVGGALFVLTLLFLVWRVHSGAIGLGEAGAAVVAVRLLAGRLQTLAGGASSLAESRLFVLDLHRFLDAAPPVDHGTPGPAAPMFDRLEVRDLVYRYPGTDRPALDGVSLDIRRGEVVALVGENGSGKTTLATVLAGLLDPTEGAVLWDGIPTAALPGPGGRPHVSVIFQDFARFQLSARENIAVGRDRVDADALRNAARLAGAAGVIEALPRGYDTVLSPAVPGGTDLSLGQWQRIALARAVYRDAGFVVLDEPTSALDPEAERELFGRIREVVAGRTVLLISHRFSSVRDADRILVLAGGRIVESGDHDELMARDGRYARMFTAQASGYLPAH